MAKVKEQSVELINLDNFKIEQLPELNGKKEEVKAELAKFPAVKIIDNETYELAKKSRTGVKTIRTGLEKEETMVVKKIKENFLGVVVSGYAEIKKDVLAIETEYQAEVTVWEDIKKKEKEARDLAEQQRIDGIKNNINDFVAGWEKLISILCFENIDETKLKFTKSVFDTDKSLFQEFSLLFDKKVEDLRGLFDSKVVTLTEQENLRLERVKLDEERAETKRIQDIKDSINSWYNNWISEINNMTAKNLFELSEKFLKEPVLNCYELQNDFLARDGEIRNMLDSKINTIKESEKQRIAHEKFLAEKKEFEEKQLKARTESRIKELTDLGIDKGILIHGLGKDWWSNLQKSAETENEEVWYETLSRAKLSIEYRSKSETKDIKTPLTPEECFEEKGRFETIEEAIEHNKNNIPKIIKDTFPASGKPLTTYDIVEIKDDCFVIEEQCIKVPKQLITDTPNDSELGRIVRQMANE